VKQKSERERRSTGEIKKAARAYVRALKEQIPGIEPEIDFEGIAGHDVWVRVPVDDDDEELSERIIDVTARLGVEFSEETGVMIVATPTVKEPAA
jgi:hypothetical protein